MTFFNIDIDTWILGITAIIIFWYTFEANKLRRETQKQTDQMIQPLVMLNYDFISHGSLRIINVSDQPALNVAIDNIYLFKNKNKFLYHDNIPVIWGEEDLPARFKLINTHENGQHVDYDISEDANIVEDIEIKLHFYNSAMQGFELKGRLSKTNFIVDKIKKLSQKSCNQ